MRNRNVYVIYLILEGMFALFFYTIITVNMVYQVEVARLNPLQLVLVGTMLEGVAFVFQVPTGVFADVFSRRTAIIIGVFLTGAGFLLEGSIPRFDTILLAQVGWGIGSSFISGAEEAWITGEVGEDEVGRVFLRGSQVSQLGALIGAAISVSLASIRINLPILVGGGLYIVLAVFLLFFMPEQHFQRASGEERPSWRDMGKTLSDGGRLVRGRPLLLTILCIAAFYGMASEGFDRLWTAHLLSNFTLPALGVFKPVVWFGVIRAGMMVLGIVATELLRRRFNTSNNVVAARLLFVLSVLQIASVITFALAGSFVMALVAYWSVGVARVMIEPTYTAWLARNVDAKVRATIISMSGQIDALGQIAGGPIIGVIGTVVSIRAAIVAAGSLLTPSLFLFGRAIRQGREIIKE